MDPLNSRQKFINEETASLFSNEKITTARNKIVECLNNIATLEKQQEKCEEISKIQELLLFQEIDLVDDFIFDIISLAHDPAVEVRKSIAAFIEKLCQKDISYLPKVVNVLVTLLRDDSPQVVKRVIQGCSSIYKNTLKYLCLSTTDVTDDLEQAWSKLCLIKTRILDMIDFENDGIRTNAIKFLEGVVILQTNVENEDGDNKKSGEFSLQNIPNTLKLLKRRKLEDEAMNIFDLLLKFHGASHISSVNLIACTGTICNIAKVRPRLLSAVVEALKNVHNNLPPTLTNSQVSTVRKHLKMQFLSLLKQSCVTNENMQADVFVILKDLGCSDAELKRYISNRAKRLLDSEEVPNKRQRVAKQILSSIEPTEEAISNSNTANEQFLLEKLNKIELVIELVVSGMNNLPQEMPSNFLIDYKPIGDISISDQIKVISKIVAKQMTAAKVGPGSVCLVESLDEATNKVENTIETVDSARQLKETLERMKGSQIIKKKAKAPAKKLQDITKPISSDKKQALLNQTVHRILHYNPEIQRNVLQKNKILSVIGSTFVPDVRKLILSYVIEDFKSRTSIILDWLFSEYCLLLGFIQSPYTKSDQVKPDSKYNQLLIDIISSISNHNDVKEKQRFLQNIYLNAPLVTKDALNCLEKMCEFEELSECALNIIVDLIIQAPSERLLNVLLSLLISRNNVTRMLAVQKILLVYDNVNKFKSHIEKYSVEQMKLIVDDKPPENLGDVWTENEVKICVALILELLPYKHNLINDIADVYIVVNSDIKRLILRVIETPIKKVGPQSVELVNLIENCKSGTETLIIRIVYLLSESGPLNQTLVDKIRNLHRTQVVTDVRLLIPIINSLSKQEVLNVLPAILKLNPVVIKEVFGRLFSSTSGPLSAIELLVAIHTLDLSQIDLKFVVKAASLCLSESEVYTHEALAVVLQQLSEISPLPLLFMRTVIQSLSLHPRLSGFVINLLQRLVLKQIWKQQKVVWDGFIKCCQRLLPASLGVLIQLPPIQLNDALQICPELRSQLLEYAQSITENQIGNVPEAVMNILQQKDESKRSRSEPDPPGME